MTRRIPSTSGFVAIALVGLTLMFAFPSAASAATPVASTFDTYSSGATTATAEGFVDPGGEATTYAAQYDVSSSVWCTTGGASGSAADTTNGTSSVSSADFVSIDLSGLTEGTSYCAQLVAANSSGEGDGGQVEWTQGAASADTFDSYSTGATTATVEGDVNPADDNTTTYEVQYDVASSTWCTSGGTSGSPANATAGTDPIPTDGNFNDASVQLTGLTDNISYCAALVATNATGTGDGLQVEWKQGAPTTDTADAFATGTSTATVNGDVNQAGDNTTTFEVHYDLGSSEWCESDGASGSPADTTTTTAVGLPSPPDGTFHDVSVNLTGLTGSADYCGELVTTNASGTSEGGQVTWTQPAPPPPPPTLTVQVQGAGGSVTSSPAGIDCPGTCSASFAPGTQVTLTATGSSFESWGFPSCGVPGTPDTSRTCTVTLGSSISVMAFFAPPPPPPFGHTLTVSRNGTGSGTVTGAGLIYCGTICSVRLATATQVTLTATPDSDSTFTGWSGGGCSGTSTCTVTLTADTTVTATFTAKPPPPPPPSPKCVVPKVKGKKLAAARSAIKHHHCSVGKVTKVRSTAKNKGKIVSQSPKPGKHLRRGSKVALKVGK